MWKNWRTIKIYAKLNTSYSRFYNKIYLFKREKERSKWIWNRSKKNYQNKINRIKEDKKELEFVLKKARKETDETIVNLAKLFEISKSSVGKYIKK